MKLDKQYFINVVRNTPLVSIDLIVRNAENEILLGLRKNEPAKGWWFVPGGRMLKNETIKSAFHRITLEELGKAFPLESALHQGVFEHIYDTNFAEHPDFGTHYIVLSFEIKLVEELYNLPKAQHGQYKWISEDLLLDEENVHLYTKAYFARKELSK